MSADTTKADYMRRWRKRNKRKAKAINARFYQNHKARQDAQSKAWAKDNPEKRKAIERRSRIKRAEQRKLSRLKFIKKNPTYRSDYCRKRSLVDLNFKITCRLRSRITKVVRGRIKSGTTISLLGCSVESFKLYLESKFEEGMSWENYGSRWEIDHVIPCALFDLALADHQRRCFHFSNMQPLTIVANRSKGAKLLPSKPESP